MIDMEKTAELLGEGFMADRIVEEENKTMANNYGADIIEGRKMMKSDKFNVADVFLKIHRYCRFMSWLSSTYGEKKFKHQRQATTFLKTKMLEILKCEGDWINFFKWLQKKTLEETSHLLYG